MGRAPCCDKANVKKGPWSPEEDTKLKNFIDTNGTGGNWITLPSKAGLKRCGKSCRLRWINYLRPDIKHGGFTEDEERIIYNLHETLGSRWSLIAAQLPGRTDNDIKNYWNTRLKKKLAERSIHTSCSQLQQQRGSYHNIIQNVQTLAPQFQGKFRSTANGQSDAGIQYGEYRGFYQPRVHQPSMTYPMPSLMQLPPDAPLMQLPQLYHQQQHRYNAPPQVCQQARLLAEDLEYVNTSSAPNAPELLERMAEFQSLIQDDSSCMSVSSVSSSPLPVHQFPAPGPLSPAAVEMSRHQSSPTSSCSGGLSSEMMYKPPPPVDCIGDDFSDSIILDNPTCLLDQKTSGLLSVPSVVLPCKSEQLTDVSPALKDHHPTCAAESTPGDMLCWGDAFGEQPSFMRLEGGYHDHRKDVACCEDLSWFAPSSPMTLRTVSTPSKRVTVSSPRCGADNVFPKQHQTQAGTTSMPYLH